MKLYKKHAFSLTELLIVLVIAAVLFAAIAPIITKRHNGNTTGDEPVWMFVNNDDQKDAYYDPGMPKALSTAFVGVNPDSIIDKKPYSKVIVKANSAHGKPQNVIQFRYGTGNGTLTGVFTADSRGNYFNTTRFNGTLAHNFNDILVDSGTVFNTAIGADALLNAKPKVVNTVALGPQASSNTGNPNNSTVIGAGAGKYVANNNVILGANSGLGRKIHSDVIIGSNTMSVEEASGSRNVVVGSNVAVAGLKTGYASDLGTATDVMSTENVVLGARSIQPDYINNSTIIGEGAYTGAGAGPIGYRVTKDITAVGYNACSSMTLPMDKGGARTCIGATSGQAQNQTPASFNTDEYDHIFLGGAPMGGYAGRSVLEVHNVKAKHNLLAKPNIGPTVVLNSNLVVRGNLYFPRVEDGVLTAHATGPLTVGSAVINRDWCTKGCCFRLWRRWKCSDFRDKNGCNIIADIFSWLINPLFKLFAEIFDWDLSKWWALLGEFDGFKASNDGRKMAAEPETNSAMIFLPGDDYVCNSFNTSGACPKLKVSDIRLKENISENTDALNKLINITPYNYTYKVDKNAVPQVGVIAQDLQEYLPNAVTTDDKGYLQIRWDEMFYVAINSIKELDSKVEKLSSEISSVEKDTEQVAQEQSNVKNRINDINKRLNKLER